MNVNKYFVIIIITTQNTDMINLIEKDFSCTEVLSLKHFENLIPIIKLCIFHTIA